MTSKPRAVLISDVHFNINTLPLASVALHQALMSAADLRVPLIVAGDLNDTKAIIRAECITAILEIFKNRPKGTRVIVLVGNHDLVNEKGSDDSLHFLDDVVEVVRQPTFDKATGLHLTPYHNSPEALKAHLDTIPKGATIIMHQGVQGAFMGDYVIDKTSLPRECFADFRVISGHYHRHQDIKCGRPRKGAVGLFSYIGSPYSMSFAEANDGPKGHQVLDSAGLLTQVPSELRKHVIVEGVLGQPITLTDIGPDDLVWIKLRGPRSELAKLSKAELAKTLGLSSSFKLDKIPQDNEDLKEDAKEVEPKTDKELLDALIDALNDTPEFKVLLKDRWRKLF